MRWWQRLFRSESSKAELDEEIAAHLAIAEAEKLARGASPDTARTEVRREFGDVALVKDATRSAWGWTWLERLLQAFRYALRQMRRSPAFAWTVIGTLAIGIAATTAMFTVVDHVLFRPLPYGHANQLVELGEGYEGNSDYDTGVPYLNVAAWREQAHSFESIAFDSDTTEGRSFLEGRSASAE
jgi:hypothetical protein